MIRRKLPQALVLLSLVLLLAAAQPAAAAFGPLQTGSGLWAEARELVGGFLRTIGLGAPEREQPVSVIENVGSILDPDGTPSASPNGAGTAPADESH